MCLQYYFILTNVSEMHGVRSGLGSESERLDDLADSHELVRIFAAQKLDLLASLGRLTLRILEPVELAIIVVVSLELFVRIGRHLHGHKRLQMIETL